MTPPSRPRAPLRRALLVALCAALAACAAPPAPAPQALVTAAPSAAPPTATATRPAATATAAAPTPTPGPRPLVVWVAEEGAALDAARALLAGADGGPVEVAARPPDGLRLSLATAALAGDPPPDLIWGDQEALAGLLADSLLQPAGRAAPDTLPALLTAATADGELWGAPVAASGALVLLYNRALVGAAPATSDQLIVAARGAATPEVAGLVAAWKEAHWVLPWLYAYGGAPTDPGGQTLTVDTPAAAEALNLVRVLHAAAEDDTTSYNAGRRMFAQGLAAFSLDGEWSLPALAAVSDTLDLGIAPLPAVPATGRPAVAPLGGTFLMFHRDLAGEKLERARDLAAWLAGDEAQGRIAGELGRLPARREALDGPAVAASPALAAAAAHAAVAPGLPPTPAARCAVFGIDVWLPSVIEGSREPAEAATLMQREAEACLAREGA
jgi:arabinogalactan oligomer/maltooligosaccharide transport system substrate-binding protein